MKLQTLAASSFLLLCASSSIAQTTTTTQPVKGNKHHVFLSTELVRAYSGITTGKNVQLNQTSSPELYTEGSFVPDISVGYFFSDKLCAGITIGGGTINPLQVSVPYSTSNYFNFGSLTEFIPSNLFARYYLFNNLGNIADVFAEVKAGDTYGIDDYALAYYPSSTSSGVAVNEFSLNCSISLGISANVSQHFAFQAVMGYLYNYNEADVPSYQYYNEQVLTMASNKIENSLNAFSFSFGLQYKI